jgi:predicted RNA binding protein YcfA (HicA-like mRNA interferase family)
MPKKIRELKQILRKAGFIELAGKGSHTNWIHPNYAGKLTISGQDGTDAKRYQERDVHNAIAEIQSNQDLEGNKNELEQDEV